MHTYSEQPFIQKALKDLKKMFKSVKAAANEQQN